MEIRFFLLLVLISLTTSTLSPNKGGKQQKQKPELKLHKGPQETNVFDRGLIDEEPSIVDILVENGAYFKDTANRNFNGTVLGYVTPWNNHGYDVAKTWGKKFDMISPVWLQVLRKGKNSYELAGKHDVDSGWCKDIRKNGKKTDGKVLKIFPRIMFDKFNENDYSKLLTYQSEREAVNDLIIKSCQQFKFDGIVLEFWQQLAARVDDEILYKLVIEMSEALSREGFKLILVIPPVRDEMHDLFSSKHFERLHSYVHAFSLMTYDFSNIQRPGANAPLHWMKSTVEHIVPTTLTNFKLKRKKILMGFNMYGYDFTPDGGQPIVGNGFLELIKQEKKRLTYDEHDVENFIELKTPTGRHIVFYPTLFSINERIKLAHELGVGISIWELGQGLDYFYDLF